MPNVESPLPAETMPILLADCNDFHASRERIFDPTLLG